MARFLPEYGLLIQHIPRCGGTFVEEALKRLGVTCSRWVRKHPPRVAKKHALLGHCYRSDVADVKYVAAFVRHPIRVYESAWRYLSDAYCLRKLDWFQTQDRWHPWTQVARLYDSNFQTWVQNVLAEEPAWVTRMFELYVGPEGGEFCDFIGRTETLVTDLFWLLRWAGFKADRNVLQRHNNSWYNRTSKRETPWTEGLLSQVRSVELPAIRRFYEGPNSNQRWFHTAAERNETRAR